MAQPQRYSARQLSQKLKDERQVEIGAEQVATTPEKRGYTWKRIRYRPALTRSLAWATAKHHDWEMLKQ